MTEVTRRAFLWRGSVAAGVAGAIASIPGLPALLTTGSQAAPGVGASESEAVTLLPEDSTLAEPVVAHVRDLSSGSIDLFVGRQQIAFKSPQLAAQLYRAAYRH